MCIQACIRNGPSEVSLLPLRNWHVVLQMLFGKAEVNDENHGALLSFTDYEISRLYITMNEASLMDVVNAVEHLHNQSNGEVKSKHVSLEFLDCLQVSPLGFHHDERLL